MVIEDYKSIAFRIRQIGIQEGRIACPACNDRGWREYYDVDGCDYYVECDTCHNPHDKERPNGCPSG